MSRPTTVFAGLPRTLLGSAERAGLRRESLISVVGIDEKQLEALEGQVPLEQHLALWKLISKRSGDPCFGLHHAERSRPEQVGIAGYAARSSPTLSAALFCIERFSHQEDWFVRGGSRQQAGTVLLLSTATCRISDDHADAVVAVDVNVARSLTGAARPSARSLAAAQASWEATELLRDAHLSISEVGFRLGFSEPSAFRRAFKRWTGMSASSYRRFSLSSS